MPELTLFDIKSKDHCACWSPSVWKSMSCSSSQSCIENPLAYQRPARLVLNYKGLDYQTTWLEYPEIEPMLKAL
jgi:hypothetical protein